MKEEVVNLLKKAIKENDYDIDLDKVESFVEVPKDYSKGDFAFPCFFLAKELKLPPHEIALQIREQIGNAPLDFSSIESDGPYVNFYLNRKQMGIQLISQIKKQGEEFGRTNLGKNKKVLIEHTSINPNASPHVGRARNALIGDSLVKILTFLNFKPEVHYLVNDVSKQIAMLVVAGAEKLDFEKMLKAYIKVAAKVKKSKKEEQKVFDMLYKFEQGDKEIVKKFNKVTNTCVKGQEKILASMGIHYDFFDYESKYLKDSKKVLEQLQKTKKLFKDKEGRLVLDLKGTSIEGKMKSPVLVLTRGDGTGLYPLRDIAYTISKMKRAEKNIIVLGEDQKLYFNQILEAMKLLKMPFPEVIHYSFILLSENGKSKKMATRKGDVVLLEDFLDEAIKKAQKEIDKRDTKGNAEKIGIGSVKYAILKNGNNKIINFNLDEALNFEGNTGPYIQYSYARASSIIKKVKSIPVMENPKELNEKETELILKLGEFPKTCVDAYNQMNPSIIANYSYKIAQIFNEFYHSCPVIGDEKENFRLHLIWAFRQVLKNSLSLLGIEVMEEM